LNGWIARSRAFARKARWSLLVPAFVLAFLWFFQGASLLTEEEAALWRKVRAGQQSLAAWRDSSGVPSLYPEYDFEKIDPWRTGFIGIEWSPVTTTLGPLEAKRTAADPLWSVYALREFRTLGLREGDAVAMISSSSFPGLVFSLLVAAEHLGLRVVWIHSLGSSTWGANIPEMLWPRMTSLLRSGGFLAHIPDWYTLGGRNESGLDMSPEGKAALVAAASEDGVSLLEARSLREMIVRKSELLLAAKPRLVLAVGGSHSTFGGEEIVPPAGGLYRKDDIFRMEAGDGVFREVLASGVPVLHFLNLRSLARSAGIPYDAPPRPRFGGGRGDAVCAAGLVFYILFLFRFRRWRRDE